MLNGDNWADWLNPDEQPEEDAPDGSDYEDFHDVT